MAKDELVCCGPRNSWIVVDREVYPHSDASQPNVQQPRISCRLFSRSVFCRVCSPPRTDWLTGSHYGESVFPLCWVLVGRDECDWCRPSSLSVLLSQSSRIDVVSLFFAFTLRFAVRLGLTTAFSLCLSSLLLTEGDRNGNCRPVPFST